MISSASSQHVLLRGGVSVPVEALTLLWDFEARGMVLQVLDGGSIVVGPKAKLTKQDREAIRAGKEGLLTVLAYEAPDFVDEASC